MHRVIVYFFNCVWLNITLKKFIQALVATDTAGNTSQTCFFRRHIQYQHVANWHHSVSATFTMIFAFSVGKVGKYTVTGGFVLCNISQKYILKEEVL